MARKVATETLESFHHFVVLVEERSSDGELVLFRGQRTDDKLLPKIARLRVKGDLIETEMRMLEAFQRTSLPFLETEPETKWDWLALMQHHGLATRLLDWTSNPFATLWFATSKPPKKDKNNKEMDGVVWLFRPSKDDLVAADDPFNVSGTRVFRPRHITKRIIAQFGWFTAHRYLNEKLNKKSAFIALEKNTRYISKLTRIRIPASMFAELRIRLDRFGVNAAVLFPDLEGLCQYIEWEHSFLEDEESRKPTKNFGLSSLLKSSRS